MPVALTVGPTIIVSVVLILSGVAKLRMPDDATGWAALGVPSWLRQEWLVRLHPYAELLLAAVLLLVGGVFGTLAAVVSVILFTGYLVLVSRARWKMPDASCACFGERRPITARTIVRNIWLVLLAVAAALTIGATPLWGGVAKAASSGWTWVLVLAALALTILLVQDPTAGPESENDEVFEAVPSDGELSDYRRVRTPAVPVQQGDGTTVNLRELAGERPILLLAVSETCGSCRSVIDSIDQYRALLPEVSVRFLLQSSPEHSKLTSAEQPQTLHDPHRYVSGSIEDWLTPSAVLLGTDGMLAGGPVSGPSNIEAFVDDIYESLNGD